MYDRMYLNSILSVKQEENKLEEAIIETNDLKSKKHIDGDNNNSDDYMEEVYNDENQEINNFNKTNERVNEMKNIMCDLYNDKKFVNTPDKQYIANDIDEQNFNTPLLNNNEKSFTEINNIEEKENKTNKKNMRIKEIKSEIGKFIGKLLAHRGKIIKSHKNPVENNLEK